jgi:hypothetical protein
LLTSPHDNEGEEGRLVINVETPGKDEVTLKVSEKTCKVFSERLRPLLPWILASIFGTIATLQPLRKRDVNYVCQFPSQSDVASRQ